MYFLYLSTVFFIIYATYKFLFENSNNIKTFDYQNEYDFYLNNINFYKNNKCIDTKYYNKSYNTPENVELIADLLYDFYVVDYNYNSKNYKYLSSDSFLTYPLYSIDKIKNHVYINNIKLAELKILNELISTEDNVINITTIVNEFVGPNYNFYKDNNYKFNKKEFISYLKAENIIKADEKEQIYKIFLYDNFNNEYSDDDDYLKWESNLSL